MLPEITKGSPLPVLSDEEQIKIFGMTSDEYWDAIEENDKAEREENNAWNDDVDETLRFIKNKVDKTRTIAIHANIATVFSCTAHFCQYCDYTNCSYRGELIRLKHAKDEITQTNRWEC